MIARFFHAWERRLVAVDTNRIVRPFAWGLEWVAPTTDPCVDPAGYLERWASRTVSDTTWFSASPCHDYEMRDHRLTFPSQIETPHPENNTVHTRYFPAARRSGRRRATLVLPQWNSDVDAHVGLCRLLARVGISALRLSLPYHDARMPAELERADYIMSANIGQTLQVNRQAVLDARRAIAWLAGQGYDQIGILGTSLGSCLAMLTAAHEPLIKAAALNHISPYFADVVWKDCRPPMSAQASTGRSVSTCCDGCGCRSARTPTSIASGAFRYSWFTLATICRFRSGCPVNSSRISSDTASGTM